MTERKSAPFLPREHGFWVMLAAAVLSALFRVGVSVLVGAVALGTIFGAVVVARTTRRLVRRDRRAQLISAALLSLAGIPIDIVGGVSIETALTTAAAWAVIFVASALVVRAAFARAREPRRRFSGLDAGAVLLAAGACVAFASRNLVAEALATGITLVVVAVLVGTRPTVKQLKPLGIALGGIAALAALALGRLGS